MTTEPAADPDVLDEADVVEVIDVALPASAARRPALATLLILVAVVGMSLYANLSTLVTNPRNFKYFPPFNGQDRNQNSHLGAEYYSIAGAIIQGRGFADPFKDETGPTAWMAPVLPVILAGLRWVSGDDKEIVTALFVLLQDLTLIASGLLVLGLMAKTTGQVGFGSLVFVGALVFYFRHCFQFTHDCWLILLMLDLFIAGLVWFQPLDVSKKRAAAWGVFGGICALSSPIVGFTWGVLTLAQGVRRGLRGRLMLAAMFSILTIMPWVIRNYLVFGRLIPVKSNLIYELYQSQCLQAGGVLQDPIFASHPYGSDNEERWLYKKLGEMAFLDQKRELFLESIRADPLDFAERVANRFFAATLEYTPFSAAEERRQLWAFQASRILFPLPFLALLVLAVTSIWRPLHLAQWIVIGVYLSYLLPYVLVSYYDRYKFPLMAVEVALVIWAVDRLNPFSGAAPAADPDDDVPFAEEIEEVEPAGR